MKGLKILLVVIGIVSLAEVCGAQSGDNVALNTGKSSHIHGQKDMFSRSLHKASPQKNKIKRQVRKRSQSIDIEIKGPSGIKLIPKVNKLTKKSNGKNINLQELTDDAQLVFFKDNETGIIQKFEIPVRGLPDNFLANKINGFDPKKIQQNRYNKAISLLKQMNNNSNEYFTQKKYAPSQIIVSFDTETTFSEIFEIISSFNGKIIKESLLKKVYTILLPESANIVELSYQLNDKKNILYAHPNWIIKFDAVTPDDDYWFYQDFDSNNTNLPNAWQWFDLNYNGTIDSGENLFNDIIIAVIDSGVDYNHEDLEERIWSNAGEIPDNGIDDDNNGFVDDVRGWDFSFIDSNDPIDEDGHGTQVAGIASATTNNNLGIAGAAWSATIMPVKINILNLGLIDTAVDGIIYAANNGADIINMSFGYYLSEDGFIGLPGHSEDLEAAVDYAYSSGCLLVASSGNDNKDTSSDMHLPSDFIQVISVGATNSMNTGRADESDWGIDHGSNYGNYLDVMGPGTAIMSSLPASVDSSLYDTYSGTSMATPYVSGVAALMKAAHLNWNNDDIKSRLTSSAACEDLGPSGWDNETGWGFVNAIKAIDDIEFSVLFHSFGNNIDSNIVLIFSDRINLDTVDSSITIQGSSGDNYAYEKKFVVNDGNGELTLDPDNNFIQGETITVTLGQGLTDLSGDSLRSTYTFSFIIQYEPEEITNVTVLANADKYTINPGDPITISGTAKFNTGENVENGTAYFNINNLNYSAAIENGFFSRVIDTGPQQDTTFKVYVTAYKSSKTYTGVSNSITINVMDDSATSYDLTTEVIYDIEEYSDGSIGWWYKDVYRTTDEAVYLLALFENLNLSSDLDLEWRFYNPDGTLYGDSIILPSAVKKDWGWAWYYYGFFIDGNLMATKPGRYKVRFYVNEDRKATHYYTVGWDFTQHRMCRDVDIDADHMYVDETNSFSPDDEKAVAWHEFNDRAQGLNVKTDYFSPDGNLYTSIEHTFENDLGPNEWYEWTRHAAHIYIKGFPPEYMCGNWVVKFYVQNPVYNNWELQYTDFFRIEENILPVTNLTNSPVTPIEGQEILLNVNASDNNHLDKIVLYWDDEITTHSHLWDDLNTANFSQTISIGSAFTQGQMITYWLEAWDESGNAVSSTINTINVSTEIVTTPAKPTCLEENLLLGQNVLFTTGGSTTNIGSAVDYQFDWGDGTLSYWGDATQSHFWLSDGSYNVKARARSQVFPERVSDWSNFIIINVINENYIHEIVTPMIGAGFVLQSQTGARLDLDALILDATLNAEYQDEYVVWEKLLDDYIYDQDTYRGVAGYATGPVTLRFAANAEGDFYVGTFNGTPEEQLAIFSQDRGLWNYRSFADTTLEASIFGEPHHPIIDLDDRHNMLGYALGNTYKSFYNSGYIYSGPSNYAELYNCIYNLLNYFDQKLTVLRSEIFHQQFDYSWYNELNRPIHTAFNNKWSPIANLPNQNSNLARNFDISYNDVNASFVWMKAGTDNNMYSDVTIYGLDSPDDFSNSGGDSYRNWSVDYDSLAETYNVHNNNSSTSQLFLFGQQPNRVEMDGYTTWSSFNTAITIAVFGEVFASNHAEYPSPGDDSNPIPLIFQVPPFVDQFLMGDSDNDLDVDGDDLAALIHALSNGTTTAADLADFASNYGKF